MGCVRRGVVGKKVPPPPEYTATRENGLYIKRNVTVRMRDGINIFIDIYRPESETTGPVPVLLGWSPCSKHNTRARLPWPAVIYPNPCGSWYSAPKVTGRWHVPSFASCFWMRPLTR